MIELLKSCTSESESIRGCNEPEVKSIKFTVCCLCSNKGMDHLSTMKRKNVVLVYDLLLEMLDANTSSGSSQTSSSPTSDIYSDQHRYPPPPSHLQQGSDQADLQGRAAEAPILDRHLQTLQPTPPPQGLMVDHMDNE